MLPIVTLFFHTIFLWFSVLYLHKNKDKYSLIPLYAFIAVFTVYTHILSSGAFTVGFSNLIFLISSTAYFTPLLIAVMILYLLEGPHAARRALTIIIWTSILQAITVALVEIEDIQIGWIPANLATYKNYFWSVTAMIIDISLIGIGWEILGKIKEKSLFASVFLLLFVIFVIDTFVFVTGVFVNEPFYWEIIRSDLITRTGLAVIMGALISQYLKHKEFTEIKREKPKSVWEIINYKKHIEMEIKKLEEEVEKRKALEDDLKDKIEELEKLNDILINRELKMVELKKELEDYKQEPNKQEISSLVS